MRTMSWMIVSAAVVLLSFRSIGTADINRAPPPTNVAQLVDHLVSPAPLIRQQAISLFESFGAEARTAIPTLATVLFDGEDHETPFDRERKMDKVFRNVLPVRTVDIDRLVSEVMEGDDQVRTVAVLALGSLVRSALSSEDFLRVSVGLVKALDDTNRYVRGWAAFGVGRLYNLPVAVQSNAVERLLKMLSSGDPALRRDAARGMLGMRSVFDRTVSALAECLRDKNVDVRCQAADTLWNYSHSRETHSNLLTVVQYLTSAMDDTEYSVRWDAVLCCRDLGPSAFAAIPALVARMNDPETHVREYAAEALGRICDRWPYSPGHFVDKDPPNEDGQDTVAIPDATVRAAVEALTKGLDDREQSVVTASANALAFMGRRAMKVMATLKERGFQKQLNWILVDLPLANDEESLVKALKDENVYVRQMAIRAAAKSPVCSQGVLAALTAGLADRQEDNGRACAWTLALKAPASVPFLWKAVTNDSAFIRARAICALGNSMPEVDTNELSHLLLRMIRLGESDSVVLWNACTTIGNVHPPSELVVLELAPLLRHTNNLVSQRVAQVIGSYGQAAKVAAPDLFDLVTNDVAKLKWAAADALAQIGITEQQAGIIAEVRVPNDAPFYVGRKLLRVLADHPADALRFLRNNTNTMANSSDFDIGLYLEIIGKKGNQFDELRDYILAHPATPIAVLALTGDNRHLPAIRKRMETVGPHEKTFYRGCARALGEKPDRAVRISETEPGNFMPPSAWPGTDPRRMGSDGGHGDGTTSVMVTGRLRMADGAPARNPRIYRLNDSMLLAEWAGVQATRKWGQPIRYDEESGRFSFFTTVFAAYSSGPGRKESGPYQTGSAHFGIEADGAKPLAFRIYDEMPDVEVTLSVAEKKETLAVPVPTAGDARSKNVRKWQEFYDGFGYAHAPSWVVQAAQSRMTTPTP